MREQAQSMGVTDFAEMYRPSEEHEAFRAAVREVCEEKVAPNAAEADELAEFPKASFDAGCGGLPCAAHSRGVLRRRG